ncbi:MAG: VanZ family protein [Anaerolineae bacterium]|nr:VanZ family protein [Anaerolineae bacterium]
MTAHVLMHTFLFGMLAYLLGVYFVGKRPIRRKQLSLLLAAVVGVAVLQEGFQFLVQARFPGWPEMFDLGVDTGGAILGVLAFGLWRERRA